MLRTTCTQTHTCAIYCHRCINYSKPSERVCVCVYMSCPINYTASSAAAAAVEHTLVSQLAGRATSCVRQPALPASHRTSSTACKRLPIFTIYHTVGTCRIFVCLPNTNAIRNKCTRLDAAHIPAGRLAGPHPPACECGHVSRSVTSVHVRTCVVYAGFSLLGRCGVCGRMRPGRYTAAASVLFRTSC